MNINSLINPRSFTVQVFKGAFFLVGGVVIYQLCNFAFRYILIHQLTTDNYGIFTFVITIVNLLTISTELNLGSTANIFLARNIKDPRNNKTIIDILFIYTGLILITISFSLIVSFLGSNNNTSLNILFHYFGLIWLLVILIGFTAIGWGILRAHKQMRYEGASNALRGLSILILVLVFVHILFKIPNINTILLFLCVSQIIAVAIVYFVIYKKNFISISIKKLTVVKVTEYFHDMSFSKIRSILAFSFLMSALSISSMLIFTIDRIMIPSLLSASMLGLYGGAGLISQAPRVISMAVIVSLMPHISERSGKFYEAKEQYYRFMLIFTLLISIGYGILILFSHKLVILLLPDEYISVVPVLRIMLVGMLFADIFSLNSTFLSCMGRTDSLKRMTVLLVVAVVMNFILNYFFIQWYDIQGAAIASAISLSLTGIVSTLLVIKTREKLVLS